MIEKDFLLNIKTHLGVRELSTRIPNFRYYINDKFFCMKVGVTSASGQLGSAIIDALKAMIGGDNLIAIARTPENAAHHGVEVRKGNYKIKKDFDTALIGLDALLLVSGNDNPENRKQQHANVIDAAKDCGVKRVVYTSIQGPTDSSDFSPIVNSNRHTEEYLKSSGLDWAIGRNGIYIEPDIEYLETYKKLGKIANCAVDGKCGYTTRAELAYAYACLLIKPELGQQTYNLSGKAITQTELTGYINKAFGTSLNYEELPVEDYTNERRAELGDFLGTVIAGIYNGIRMGAFDNPSDYEKAAGRPHISWEEYFANLS